MKTIDAKQSVMWCPRTTIVIHPFMRKWSSVLLFSIINVSLFIQTLSDKCETRELDETPPNPHYDASEITINAANSLAEFLQSTSTKNIEKIRKKANNLATLAIEEDENLLAVAIAGPSIPLAVVQFRDRIQNTEDSMNHTFLNMYWRELGVAWNHTDGSQFWGIPFKDCGPLQGRWLWPFSVIVHEAKHRIIATSFIAADVDQCNDALESIFGKKHSCDRKTTFCLPSDTDFSSTRGSYTCVCKDKFYLPNATFHGFNGNQVEEGNGNFSCLPCPDDCSVCDSSGDCIFGEQQELISTESLVKVSISATIGATICCCLVLSIIVYRARKSKVIATGMWTILETILFGIILLYLAVALHFFPASTVRCLLEPWFRELGFVICYGAIILKLYRHLIEFRTRKAHRWVVRDMDLLKYLCAMIVAVLCYLSAFTAYTMDFLEMSGLNGLEEETTNTCRSLKWDYVTQAGEFLILVFGLHICFASRNANTQFRERQFLVASLFIEFIVSSSYYVFRDMYSQDLSPGVLFLALFGRSQLTNTVTLGLIFFPKIWYHHKHDSYDGHRMGGGGLPSCAVTCAGDPEISDVTISEMNPEDIRAELKRLYTQLEVFKNKSLRQDNPHISKRRGGRKVAHRRFSLQKKGSKDKASAKRNHRAHHTEIEVTEAEPSRTPEDSVCSAEGPTDTGAEMSGISSSK